MRGENGREDGKGERKEKKENKTGHGKKRIGEETSVEERKGNAIDKNEKKKKERRGEETVGIGKEKEDKTREETRNRGG